METTPTSIEIRSFQVGFGDCFLLSFVYGEKDCRHVLIDFGSTGLVPKKRKAKNGDPPTEQADAPPGPKPSVHMPKVAAAIRAACATSNGEARLAAVIATHRHADHISGFATDGGSGGSGTIIKGLRPKVVIQPWTEDPKAATDAKSATPGSTRTPRGFVGGLAAMSHIGQAMADWANHPSSGRLPASTRRQLGFLGMDNIANKSAVDNLREMSSVPGSRAVYARYGDDVGLSDLLPGVKVTVLGPPDLTQSGKISKMRKRDPDQYWHLMGASPAVVGAAAASVRRDSRRAQVPPEARWFRQRLERLQSQSLLQIVRSLDDQMNNTSLILLFEVGGKKLLFPGDAQFENWSYALEDAPEAAANRERLAGVDVYKVGHHGSLNATPKALLWEKFKKRGASPTHRMRALVSTLHGMHGDGRSKTEVPRTTLLNALQNETDLNNTEKYLRGEIVGPPIVIKI